ncbi:MAG TPA: endolytic transglycosylase MltG [Desulfarculaceae bacterium]|nr:endolytic transglycosylase MltG [Desulfarculaceae bacterium]
MRHRKSILILLLAAMIFLTLAGFDLYRFAHHSNRQPAKIILITPGSSLRKITRILTADKLINSERRFIILNRLLRSSALLKAGEYQIAAGASPLEIISTLQQGISLQHKISFPEGFTLKQIKNRLIARDLCPAAALEQLTNNPNQLKKWQLPATGLEGYLFPSTYHYNHQTSCRKIIEQMLETGKQRFLEISAASPATPLNRHQILTLAAIIQKEAGNLEEMPLIAAVFHNRLQRKMRLASDPTTIYGLGEKFDGNLRRRDLKSSSPYNTYRFKGLPPGPICSPGSDAIKAALNPAVSDYLFFVSRNNGSHQFSKTYTEHKRAVKKYQLGH